MNNILNAVKLKFNSLKRINVSKRLKRINKGLKHFRINVGRILKRKCTKAGERLKVMRAKASEGLKSMCTKVSERLKVMRAKASEGLKAMCTKVSESLKSMRAKAGESLKRIKADKPKVEVTEPKSKGMNRKALLRTALVSVIALALIVSATLAWYINKMDLWGVEFNTGNIDFNTYIYSADGELLSEPLSSNDEDETQHINAPLFTIENGQVGSTGTAYIAVESTGSIGIQYRIAFGISGKTENSIAYLGGYKYNVTKVTDKVDFEPGEDLDVSDCPSPEKIESEMVTIDRNAVNGTIENKNGYDVYRIDYTLVHKNQEYTGAGINIFYNIFATQIDGDFEDTEERAYTYYCSTREDIDRARIEAYPGDIIKLSADIVYYGDLVFNKPISLETNDFTLTVNGNLIYDYVLGQTLELDVGGLGRVVVQCTKEGVGGNLLIKTPISNVVINGANASNGDMVVENDIIIDATNAYGSAGVSFNEVKIVDLDNIRKAIQLESNTRATVSFGTAIRLIQAVTKANNIEIVNNGEIEEIVLTKMGLLEQTNSPQIYILNNNDITNPIALPSWSEKFVANADGTCSGNTKIIQSYSGSTTQVSGNCVFDNYDVDVERADFLVEQIREGNDSRLRIYYQDYNGQVTSIQSILENYLNNEATTGCAVYEVLQLEIVSVGDKAVTADDIAFMNSDSMLSLKQLDMQRANVYENKLPDRAFESVSKYESLVLPQSLVEIGDFAFNNSSIDNVITIPSGVSVFGSNWFNNGKYVSFASSVPITQASAGLTNVKAIFVDETYIESYKSVYSSFASKIYPISVMDETKTHFVRNLQRDEWEITYLISGLDEIIGENISIDGTNLKIVSVYDNAYRHNYIGTSVKFVDTVVNLGAGNFYNNKNITDADLTSIKYIGDEVFCDDPKLSQVILGDSLETIGAKAFLNCTNLNQEIMLPETMQSIGASAFQNTKITAINTGGATSIGGYAFANCTSLIYAELPRVEYIGEDGTNYLFSSDSSLVSVKLPALIKAGGTGLFEKCTSLRELYMGVKDEALTLGTNPYSGCNTAKLKLFVPEEHIEFYRGKCPGGINALMIYPQGEKLGEELVNGFNIGIYIVSDNGDGTYTLVTSNVDHTDEVVIPEEFNGSPITKIYDHAFRNQSFKNVTLKLGNSVKIIGKYAFYQRNGLIEVEFGNSLEIVDVSAFEKCTTLSQDLALPNSMVGINAYAFKNTGILSLNTGGATYVETEAFANCTSLVYVNMPEMLVVAESGTNSVFSGCSSLVSVDMSKVSKIYGTNMFGSCGVLTEVYMRSNDPDASFTTNLFTGKIKLFVPADLVTFYQNSKITNSHQIFPIGEKIGDNSINGFLLGDYIVMENGTGYTLVTSNLNFQGDVTLPNEYNGKPITEIYANAFRFQTFTDVNLVFPENITSVGNYTFYGATGLKSVDLKNVTAVGEYAFSNATNLSSIVMDNVVSASKCAFYVTAIRVVNCPKLTYTGQYVFGGCNSLESVSMPAIVTISNAYLFYNSSNLKYVYFENIMSIPTSTFNTNSKLEKIIINRIINVGEALPGSTTIHASAPCKIYVPYRSLAAYGSTWSGKPVVTFDISATHNGDTYILSDNNGKYVLIDFMAGQTNPNLVIPTTVYSDELGDISIHLIKNGAFTTVASNLKSITLSSTIARVEGKVLSECTGLENIYVDANSTYYASINGVLYSKDKRMLVQYPLGRSGAFDMSGGEYDSTLAIGAGAFAGDTDLTRIVFPESLLAIDSTAFANCTQLNRVEFTGNTPPVLMGQGIFNTEVEDFSMAIPTGDSTVVEAYLCAYNFDEYVDYIDLGGNSEPDSSVVHNRVFLSLTLTREIV